MLIETERLQLQRMTMADLDQVVALHAEPDITRFFGVFDRERVIERLHADERHWNERGHGLLAVLDRDRGCFLGRVGLKYLAQFDETEIGWVLRSDACGHGFATEAARAYASWGFRNLSVPYLTAMIRPDNTRSIRVAERLGMTTLRTDVHHDEPAVVYSVGRENWPGVTCSGTQPRGSR
jgi:RimJ/RimL family protein N-acetyltransferase